MEFFAFLKAMNYHGLQVGHMNSRHTRQSVGALRIKVLAALYGSLFVFLVLSEFINAAYNPKYDQQGLSLLERVPLAFKPTVMALFVVFTTILFVMVMRYLKPLLSFVADERDPDKARVAAIRMPWTIILFQVGAWTVGTVAYYAMRGWEAESGIHVSYGIATKIVTGFLSAMYVTFFINLIMQESKRSLGVTDIRPGERDIFSRYKDYLATISGVLFVVVYASYISSYFAASGERLETLMFITRAMPGFLVLGVVGVIPVFLSKREYNMQVEGILKEMRELTEGTIDRSNQIDIVNFDELGELSMYVNRNVVRYREFADSIQNLVASLTEASLSLATTAQQNSSVSNQQAAAVAEVVSTMEDSDRLGKTAAERAAEVDIKSVKTLQTATEGVSRMDGYLESMESIRKANEGTIEFIKTLNEDINTIWDVVRMINSIANQVKIIAFNAELEASSAGPAGKNFEIVATEIRRLADNTVASTAEIRDKTQLIEQAARNLIESSDSTTKAIQSGWENSRKIQEAFNSVKQSSEDASASAKAINDGIRMQTGGSEQILMTMKQIAHSASDFAESTKMLSETSRRLTDMVAGMRKLSEAQGHGS
jgi:methyl-accepting chemotaxis protein